MAKFYHLKLKVFKSLKKADEIKASSGSPKYLFQRDLSSLTSQLAEEQANPEKDFKIVVRHLRQNTT